MNNNFRLLLRVRYGECDAQQVVFNARYGEYADLAATEYFRALFGDYKELLSQGIDTQVVRLATDWQSPARFDEVLSISVETTHLGNSSFSLRVEFCEYYSGRPVAVSEIVYVVVSTDKYEKMPIPDELRQRLAQGAPGVVTNQAGVV